MRTRKRDDDSQYNNSINSDATSLAALDASSICATGSRSSLSISSIKNYQGRRHNQRPRKRRRKSLTEALQSISLDKDRGVPAQICKMGGKFPFSNSSGTKNSSAVSFTIAANTDDINGANVFGSDTSGVPNSTLNSRQQLERRLDRDTGGPSGDGDLYYDDDNSQLTSSTDGCDEVDGEDDGMEDDYDHDEEDDDEDSHTKKLALMTDFEKAQRKVMLELVFGSDHNDHKNSRKTAAFTTMEDLSFSDREVSSCARAPPPIPISQSGAATSLSPPPPFATISTTTRLVTESSIKKTTENNDDDSSCKDPADRKIKELLRRSLKNLKEGSHPLQFSKLGSADNADDSNLFVTTPWKTQDDMAIDPQVYSPSMGEVKKIPSDSMAIDANGSNITTTKESNNGNSFPVARAQPQVPPIGHSVRPRSNSLPGGLDMIGAANTAMEMDG